MTETGQLTTLHRQWFQTGAQLHEARRWAEAEAVYRLCILAQQPNVPEVYYNLGISLKSQGKLEEAIESFNRALALRPDFPEACNNLGNTLRELERPAPAIEVLRRAVTLRGDYAAAWNNLAVALKCTGQLDESLACLGRAVALRPGHVESHDNYLYSLCFHPRYDAPAIFAQARRWNEQFARPLQKDILPHDNDPSPGRRLRIGYVSGRFPPPLPGLVHPAVAGPPRPQAV